MPCGTGSGAGATASGGVAAAIGPKPGAEGGIAAPACAILRGGRAFAAREGADPDVDLPVERRARRDRQARIEIAVGIIVEMPLPVGGIDQHRRVAVRGDGQHEVARRLAHHDEGMIRHRSELPETQHAEAALLEAILAAGRQRHGLRAGKLRGVVIDRAARHVQRGARNRSGAAGKRPEKT